MATGILVQPLLLDDVARVERPWKRQRSTARAVYRQQRAVDTAKAEAGHETRQGQALRCLSAYWNRYQASPTALELLSWAKTRGENLFDVNSLRPRLTALVDAGVVETAAKRACTVSGQTVYTWRVREAGSVR